jgi:signal transduction histidine kinase
MEFMNIDLLLRLLLTLLLPAHCLLASAQDNVTQRAVYEDKRGDMRFSEVLQAEFSVIQNKVISLGYTRSPVWIRLQLDDSATPRRLVLNVVPATLNEVMLFSTVADEVSDREIGPGGRLLSRRASLVDVPPGKAELYLRIHTQGPMMLSPTILSAALARDKEIHRGIALGIFLACSAMVLLALLVLILNKRQSMHFYFMLNIAISTLLFLNAYGYLSELFVQPRWLDFIDTGQFLFVVNGLTTALFLRELLGHFGLPDWGRLFFRGFWITYTPLFFLFFIADRQIVMFTSTIFMLIGSVTCIPLTAVVFWRRPYRTWLIALLVIFLLVYSIRFMLILCGLIVPADLTTSLLGIRGASVVAVFFTIFWLVDREQQEFLTKSILEGAVLRERAEFEKHGRENKDRFMAMLLHEFKNPMAIIQVAVTSLGRNVQFDNGGKTRVKNINRAVDDINAIIERCMHACRSIGIGINFNRQTTVFAQRPGRGCNVHG